MRRGRRARCREASEVAAALAEFAAAVRRDIAARALPCTPLDAALCARVERLGVPEFASLLLAQELPHAKCRHCSRTPRNGWLCVSNGASHSNARCSRAPPPAGVAERWPPRSPPVAAARACAPRASTLPSGRARGVARGRGGRVLAAVARRARRDLAPCSPNPALRPGCRGGGRVRAQRVRPAWRARHPRRVALRGLHAPGRAASTGRSRAPGSGFVAGVAGADRRVATRRRRVARRLPSQRHRLRRRAAVPGRGARACGARSARRPGAAPRSHRTRHGSGQ